MRSRRENKKGRQMKETNQNEAVNEAVNEAPDTAEAAETAELEALKAELEAVRAEAERLKSELKEKEDKYLRLAAEYDNFRRRSREEKEATYNNALADTVTEILPIIDNLERAAAFTDGEKVKDGLVMIAGTVGTVLERLGVEAFGAAGDKFDPNIHNAVFHEEDDSEREDEITEVFQKGYKKGNRIIRFAMVKTVN